MINAKTAFGIVADGSDETAKINQAIAAAGNVESGDLVYFPPGLYGCDGLDEISSVVNFYGAGPRKTVFKNLSPDTRLFEFAKGTFPSQSSAFSTMGGMSIDQNGCTANGIEMNVMYSRLRDMWIYGQAGGGYAISAKDCTLSKLIDDVHITDSNNGLKLDTCYYPRIWNCSIERKNGVALKIVGCSDVMFQGFYVDHGTAQSGGNPAPEVIQCQDSDTINFYDLSMELHGVNNVTPNRQMHFLNTSNLNFIGGRIYHSGQESSTYMLFFEDCSAVVQGFNWFETVSGQILAGAKGSNTSIVLRDIVTYNTAAGSKYGLGCWEGKIKRVSIENWTDRISPVDTYPNAAEVVISQVDSNIL